MSPQEDLSGEGNELKRIDIEKRRLECEKLRAEIADISLSWWQRPTYAGSVLTLAALLTGWVSGYFPSERETLQKEIASLRTEKTNRTEASLLLNSDLARLQDERNDFKQQVARLDAEKANLATEIQRSQRERDSVKQQLSKLDGEKRKLAIEIQQDQDKIDATYIRLKIASVDAQYAISHIAYGGYSVLPKDRDRFTELLKKLSSSDAELVGRLTKDHEFAIDIANITAKDLKELDKGLSSLGSTKRISMQLISPMEVRTPDGRTYKMENVKKAEDAQLLQWFRTKTSR